MNLHESQHEAVTPASKELFTKHYKTLADNYDLFLKYSPDFIRRMTAKMIDKLRLMPGDVFVDLGAGTGIYSSDIVRQVPLEAPVILVDPFEEMLAHAPQTPQFRHICLDALSFARRPGRYDKVLIKEAIHHIEPGDRPALFAALRERLDTGGRLLLVHIPPRIDYPLFDKAIERSLSWHADPDSLVAQLGDAGFAVERGRHVHHHRLPKETYFAMVEGRYMSLLSSFDDDEMAAGLNEMAKRYVGQDTLEFDDVFDFITATKA